MENFQEQLYVSDQRELAAVLGQFRQCGNKHKGIVAVHFKLDLGRERIEECHQWVPTSVANNITKSILWAVKFPSYVLAQVKKNFFFAGLKWTGVCEE